MINNPAEIHACLYPDADVQSPTAQTLSVLPLLHFLSLEKEREREFTVGRKEKQRFYPNDHNHNHNHNLFLLLLLFLLRFVSFLGHGFPFAGVKRQLSFYELRISVPRQTPNLEGQCVFLCAAWVALPAATLPPA